MFKNVSAKEAPNAIMRALEKLKQKELSFEEAGQLEESLKEALVLWSNESAAELQAFDHFYEQTVYMKEMFPGAEATKIVEASFQLSAEQVSKEQIALNELLSKAAQQLLNILAVYPTLVSSEQSIEELESFIGSPH